MNKLIIVGNGFDIHNGLATRYSDFLKWYLNGCFEEAFNYYFSNSVPGDPPSSIFDNLLEIKIIRLYSGVNVTPIKNVEEFTNLFFEKINRIEKALNFSYRGIMLHLEITIHSDLFKDLLNDHTEKNWVDIEMTYYNHLKNCLRDYNDERLRGIYSDKYLLKINNELETIKNKLEIYLKEISENRKVHYDFNYCAEGTIDTKIIIDKHHLKNLVDSDYEDKKQEYINPKNITLLNFNYTGLTYKLERRTYNHIDIHGSLRQLNNKPIFGFGDEIDADYHEMEKTNINAFLTHIKSFGYFKNSKYHDLINFLESDSYVVYIWGHSCGLSDRTLLSMIFEHDNCAAIKPYYWEKERGVNNYTEITQNISRHFRNKLKMRNRVVNFEFCYPLGSQH